MRHTRSATSVFFAASLAWLAIASTSTNAAEGQPPRRLLFFSRSVAFQHSVVAVKDGKPCYAETILEPICKEHGWELVSTKDGTVFTPENIAKFDAILFYTQGDLESEASKDGSRPMSKEGKQALLDAVKGGKGFVGFHCASDTFHSPGQAWEAQPADKRDSYIDMVGGEFIVHQSQQETTMTVVDPKFPGAGSLGHGFKMLEEWYSLKNFADDLHVLLVNETKGMHDKCYDRPPYPASWIRNYGKGRVFYTSMGHREDVWTRPEFQSLVTGGITWAVGDAKADTTPNIKQVTPKANQKAADEVMRLKELAGNIKMTTILAEVTKTVYVSNGIGIGSALAVVCSWQRNRSILWAILAGIFGWLYVIYFAITRRTDELK